MVSVSRKCVWSLCTATHIGEKAEGIFSVVGGEQEFPTEKLSVSGSPTEIKGKSAAHKINLMRCLTWFNSQFNFSKQVTGLSVKH